jgi:hypothetical protein
MMKQKLHNEHYINALKHHTETNNKHKRERERKFLVLTDIYSFVFSFMTPCKIYGHNKIRKSIKWININKNDMAISIKIKSKIFYLPWNEFNLMSLCVPCVCRCWEYAFWMRMLMYKAGKWIHLQVLLGLCFFSSFWVSNLMNCRVNENTQLRWWKKIQNIRKKKAIGPKKQINFLDERWTNGSEAC